MHSGRCTASIPRNRKSRAQKRGLWKGTCVGSSFRIADIEATQVKLTRLEKVRRGMIAVEDLDDEEILNGVVRDESGHLPSRRSKQLPREMMDEFKRRMLSRGVEKLGDLLFDAVDALGSIVRDPEASDTDRMNASKFIIERVLGKEVKIVIKPDDPIDRIFKELMTSGDGLEDSVLTGEVVDDDA